MFSTLPLEIREQIWIFVCRDEAVTVRGMDKTYVQYNFRLVPSRDVINTRIMFGEQAMPLIHKHAMLNLDAILEIESLRRVFSTSQLRHTIRAYRRIKVGYYGLFRLLHPAPCDLFDQVDELHLTSSASYWPLIDVDDDDTVSRRSLSTLVGARKDQPIVLARFCLTQLPITERTSVTLLRCNTDHQFMGEWHRFTPDPQKAVLAVAEVAHATVY